jgi:hypothetical protein
VGSVRAAFADTLAGNLPEELPAIDNKTVREDRDKILDHRLVEPAAVIDSLDCKLPAAARATVRDDPELRELGIVDLILEYSWDGLRGRLSEYDRLIVIFGAAVVGAMLFYLGRLIES